MKRMLLGASAGILLSFGCVADDTESPDVGEASAEVVGGTSEPDSWHPWVLEHYGLGNCRAILIDPSWALTAAHCIPTSFVVPHVAYTRTDPVTGATHTDERYAQSNPERRVYVHPGWNPATLENDIALLKLESPFTPDRYIQTVALPTNAALPGDVGVVASFKHGGGIPDDRIAIYRAPIEEPDDCFWSSDTVFCTEVATAGLCGGDSGSGLVRTVAGRATVIGIASFTQDTTQCESVGGYVGMTDVEAYVDWIRSTMNKTQAELDGNARVRWSGERSTGLMSLACKAVFGSSTTPYTGPMNAVGAEVRRNCPTGWRPVATCDLTGTTGLEIKSFQLRRTDPSTGVTTTTNLPYQPLLATHTGSSATPQPTSEYICSVGRKLINQ